MSIALAWTLSLSFFLGADADAVPGRNRLAGHASPYLRLHADNPVHWFAWGQEAFAEAKRTGKPILLSIGYSSCHWCHVMNRESFADPKIAELLNQHFICVKVDREERPDVDNVYMQAVQALTDNGGWPLNVFLLPDGRPFLGGTYFPPEDRVSPEGQIVMSGFPRVLAAVLELLEKRRPDVEKQAAALTDFLRRNSTTPKIVRAPLGADLVPKALASIADQWDPTFGGLADPPGYAPKFPMPSIAIFLIESGTPSRQKQYLDAVELQARRMAEGGLFDQVGGGFHRYCVDREWIVPHFEKMLYDQGQLLSLYSRLQSIRPGSENARVIQDTISFVLRELASPDGLFYSALDADSEHEEGKFHVWTREELRDVLGEDAAWFFSVAGVLGEPRFEGKFILTRKSSGMPEGPEEIRRWNDAKQKLLAARNQRVRPLLDNKVITSWNALFVLGLCDAAHAMNREEYGALAIKTLERMLFGLKKPDGTLYRYGFEGSGRGDGFADDYASMVLALLAVHQIEPSDRYLDQARSFMAILLEKYWDPVGKGFFYSGKDQEALVAPYKETHDGAMPSSNSLACLALVELAKRTGDKNYLHRAGEVFDAFQPMLAERPSGCTTLLRAFARYLEQVPSRDDAATKSNENVKIAFLSAEPPSVTIPPGGKAFVRLRFQVADGWHVNANPAKPVYLKPILLRLEENPSVVLDEIQYPQGESLLVGGLEEPVSVHAGAVTLRAGLSASSTGNGEETLTFLLDYQACDDKQCLAPSTLKFSVPFRVRRDP